MPDPLAELCNQGGWTGTCPVPGCRVHLQGRDRGVVGLHLEVVHPEWPGRTPYERVSGGAR